MALTDHVSVTITLQSVGVPRAGFGMPMIVTHNAGWVDRVRYASRLSEVSGTLGFATTSPEYLAATAFWSQTPKPPTIAFGRATATVTQRYKVNANASALQHSTEYFINVSGEGFEDDAAAYTTDSVTTRAEIHVGLLTALNAVVDKNYTAEYATLIVTDFTFTADNTTNTLTKAAHTLVTGDGPFQLTTTGGLPAGLATVTDYWAIRLTDNTFQLATTLANALAGTAIDITTDGTGTQTLTDTASTKSPDGPLAVTGDAAGNWFSLEGFDPDALQIEQNHTVSGIGDDLTAILNASNGLWYEIHTLYNSKDYVGDVAAWTEANGRLYVFDTCDTDCITLTYSAGVTTDVLSTLFELGYKRTMGAYHQRPAAQLAAAWMGRWLPTTPGRAIAKFKTLAGVETTVFTTTHVTNLKARRGNGYQTNGGRGITFDGTVFSTEYLFVDVTRNLDWLSDEVVSSVYELLADSEIVPYDEEGLLTVKNGIKQALQRAVRQRVLAASPAPAVEMPLLEDISDADKANRILREATFSGTLAGAVQAAFIDGSLSF